MARQRGPKEITYDERIAPLMDQVINACKAAGISVHASFDLDTASSGNRVAATTHIASEDADPDWLAWYDRRAGMARRGQLTGGPTDGFIMPRGAAGRQPS